MGLRVARRLEKSRLARGRLWAARPLSAGPAPNALLVGLRARLAFTRLASRPVAGRVDARGTEARPPAEVPVAFIEADVPRSKSQPSTCLHTRRARDRPPR